uniref:uncharacterized protein LOC124068652 n=1 Tax=Scatophagus argus TaxID=75038 RepID=UPI001ED7FAD2|nr:uncharacterized protein LOC124068652 [Scatophagus argus]
MGAEQSILEKNGYTPDKKTIKDNSVVATKGGEKFLIKKITSHQTSGSADLESEIEILKTISHPHIVSCKNSFKVNNAHYVVMNYCEGGSLAAQIREGQPSQPHHESQVLSWIVEICMALKTIHDKGLIHKNLKPENISLTEFGTVCLGDFGKINENCSTSTQSTTNQTINCLAPEVFTEGTYDAKSDIWSLGCLLYELCTLKPASSAETPTKLIPKIIGGRLPSLTEPFSPELCELLNNMLSRNPQSRPTASEILERPIMINCLSEKCKSTVEKLQKKLGDLRGLADGLERVHQGTTIGSLAGGVIGAAGGITSIVGLILAPFTLGASLIVTGIGIGVGVLGGVTAGASNITNMVNQSADRKAVRCIIKEFEEKINAVVIWLQELLGILQTIRSRFGTFDTEFNKDNLFRIGSRAGKGLGGIAELVRLAQVMNIGRIAAQASRAVRVAEVATGVFSALFVAVDIFFIAMDAKEIHHIRQAQAAEDTGGSSSESESSQNTTPVRSEVMKFVLSIRQAADNVQKVLDELKGIISSIPSVQDESSWTNMALMNISLTEFGTVCLGDFGKINENCSTSTQLTTNHTINCLAPEVFIEGTNDDKSDIWSLGCLIYELCTLKPAFSAETPTKLIPKIIGGRLPSLTEPFSPELCELLNDMLSRNPQSRPTANEILHCPIMINCLSEKCKSTVETLQKKLGDLRGLADGLERVHQGATIGSLAGGVIGAAGGITSLVGLVLAPFTLGTSLIVTGVGVGVGVLGGVTAGASNITKMVTQSADRKAVRCIIKEFEEKINAVVIWHQELMGILHTIRNRFGAEPRQLNENNLLRLNAGIRAGRGLVGIAELARLAQVMNVGKIAAQASRVVRVAELATGVFSGLFVAVDIFFIAMDAKEIHHIKQAQAAEDTGASSSESESSQNTTPVRSEVMKFVRSIRQAEEDLQKVLDELKGIISSIPSFQDEGELCWTDMELM